MSLLRLFLLLFLIPQMALAQAAAPSGLGSLIGFIFLIVVAFGIPTIVGIGVRVIFKTTLVSYLLSYLLLLGLYILVWSTFEGVPGTGVQSIAFNLLPLSMFGSVIAHWIYYLKLPTRGN